VELKKIIAMFILLANYILLFVVRVIILLECNCRMAISYWLITSGCLGLQLNNTAVKITRYILIAVILIRIKVIFFRETYIESDKHLLRFKILLMLFIRSIVILLIGKSRFILILGWDGLGLSSYFLVVFYLNTTSNSGGLITILRNRVGDVFIILVILLLLSIMRGSYTPNIRIKIISWLVLIAAITKRAIFPYISWLPEAIAAPTPVSRLVHSSTLVTAGVILLYQIREWRDNAVWAILSFISFISLCCSSWSAVISQDIKKVVALSTLRQLSLIIISLSIGLKTLAVFHLIAHAIFKSCLFLSVGAVIHLRASRQESRLLRGAERIMALRVIIISLICLCGAPFSSAYFTKERVIMIRVKGSHPFIIIRGLILRALFTLLYSIKFVFLNFSSNNLIINSLNTKSMHKFILLLAFISIVLGFSLSSWLNNPYSPSFILVRVIIRFFLLSTWGLLINNKILFKDIGAHLIFGLKYLFTRGIPIKRIKTTQLIYVLWEVGVLSVVSVYSWQNKTKLIASQWVYIRRSIFSKQLSIFLILILIMIILY